jgi:iron complex transport system substrate-binding protein
MRIVSLIASATEIVHALGLTPHQVGRSHECDYPPGIEDLPVCTKPRFATDGTSAEIDKLVKQTLQQAGSVYEVFDDLLENLGPTHILTQTQCKVCAVSLDDVQRALANRFSTLPEVVALEPNSLADIWEDIRRVGGACGVSERAAQLIAELQERMNAISQRAARVTNHPRVAVIEWIEPLMAAGNWTPELLQLAHAENLFGEARRLSPWLEWDQLKAAQPDVLLVTACGFDVDRTRSELYWLTQRPDWHELKSKVYVADGNHFFNRPGPRVVETLRILCEILYPEEFEQTTGWEAFLRS